MSHQLFIQLSDEEKDQIVHKLLNYVRKMEKGWEPTKSEALQFLLQFQSASPIQTFLNQIWSEWEEEMTESTAFIPWMVELEKWITYQYDDNDSEQIVTLLNYTRSVICSFHLAPFSAYETISSNLSDFFLSSNTTPADCISFPSPFPPFSPRFSSVQYASWMNTFQNCLLQYASSTNLTTIASQLHSITPNPPFPLLASISLLENDMPLAHDYLLKSVSLFPQLEISLLPLVYYSIIQQSPKTRQLLQELRNVLHISRNAGYDWLFSLMEVFTTTIPELKLRYLERSLQQCSKDSKKSRNEQNQNQNHTDDDDDGSGDGESSKRKGKQIVCNVLLRMVPFYPSFLSLSCSPDFPCCREVLTKCGWCEDNPISSSTANSNTNTNTNTLQMACRTVEEGMEWLIAFPTSIHEIMSTLVRSEYSLFPSQPSSSSSSSPATTLQSLPEFPPQWIGQIQTALQRGDDHRFLTLVASHHPRPSLFPMHLTTEELRVKECIVQCLRQRWECQHYYCMSSMEPINSQSRFTIPSSSSTTITTSLSSQRVNGDNEKDMEIPLIRAISTICEGICIVVHLHKQLSPPFVEAIRRALSLACTIHLKQAVQWCLFLLISYEGEDNRIKTVRRWKSLLGLVEEVDELVCLVKKTVVLAWRVFVGRFCGVLYSKGVFCASDTDNSVGM